MTRPYLLISLDLLLWPYSLLSVWTGLLLWRCITFTSSRYWQLTSPNLSRLLTYETGANHEYEIKAGTSWLSQHVAPKDDQFSWFPLGQNGTSRRFLLVHRIYSNSFALAFNRNSPPGEIKEGVHRCSYWIYEKKNWKLIEEKKTSSPYRETMIKWGISMCSDNPLGYFPCSKIYLYHSLLRFLIYSS